MSGGDRPFDGSGVGVGVELDVGRDLGVFTIGVEVGVVVGDCVPSGAGVDSGVCVGDDGDGEDVSVLFPP